MHATRLSAHAEPTAPAFELAQVVDVEGRCCRVRCAGGRAIEARIAASCLVQPCAGDRVALLCAAGVEVAYVWAVLERAEGGPIAIAAPEGLCVSAPAGAVVISAERVELLSRQRVGVTGASVDVDARDLRFTFSDLQASGERASLHIEALRFLGKTLSSVLERALTRVRRNYRVVEELEQVSGRQLDYRLSETFSVRGKNTLITAEELVKLDGKQLHLG